MQSARMASVAAYRTAAIVCGVFLAAGLTIAAIGPSLPVLASRVGSDVAALGGLFTALSTGVLLAQGGVVWARQRFGSRIALTSSILLMAVSGVAIAQGAALLAVFVAAFFCGLGFGGVLALGNTLVAQLFAARSAAALNGINVFFGVGSIIGPSLAAAMGGRLGAPQMALWIGAGALALLVPLALVAAAYPASEGHTTATETTPSAPVRSWLLGLLLFFYTGIEIGFAAWLTLYMITSAAFDVTQAALFVSAFWFALTTGRGLAAVLGVRLSGHSLLRLCLGGILLGALLLAVGVGNTAVTFAGIVALGISCGPVFPTTIALLTASAAGNAAVGKALVLGNGGGMLLPALIGLVLSRYGPSAVAVLIVVAACVMIGLGIAAMRPHVATIVADRADCPSI